MRKRMHTCTNTSARKTNKHTCTYAYMYTKIQIHIGKNLRKYVNGQNNSLSSSIKRVSLTQICCIAIDK